MLKQRVALLALLWSMALCPGMRAQPVAEKLESWKLLRTIQIPQDLHHVQGIDVEGDTLWVTSVDAKAGKGYLYRIQLPSGTVERSVEVQDGKRIHPGGIQRDGKSIWLPVAEYDRDGPSWIERRDKKTLALISRFLVEDHIGCVAVDSSRIVGGNSSTPEIYTWTKEGKALDRRANPHRTEWQDLKFVGHHLVGSGNLSRQQGAIEWLSLPGLEMQAKILAGQTDRGLPYTHEGMTIYRGKLYLLPEDAPTRLFIFQRR